jgi:hypothetical protein
MRILFLFAFLGAAHGATVTSIAAGGAWAAPATWAGGQTPAPGDDVVLMGPVTITAGTSVTVGRSLPPTPTWKAHIPATTLYAPTVQASGDGAGCGSSTGGNLQAGSYYAVFTWANANGETAASAESAQFTVASGGIPCVTMGPLPPGVASWNLYVTAAGGPRKSETLYASGITAANYAMSAARTVGAAPPPYGAGGIRIASGGGLTINGTLNLRGDLAPNASGVSVSMGAGGVLEFDSSLAAAPSLTSYHFNLGSAYNQGPAINLTATAGSRGTVRSNPGGANAFFSGEYDPATGTPGTYSSLTFAYIDFQRIGTAAFLGFYLYGGSVNIHHCTFDETQEMRGYTTYTVTQSLDIHHNTWRNSLPLGSAAISSIVVSGAPQTAQVNTAMPLPAPRGDVGLAKITGAVSDPGLNGEWCFSGCERTTQNSATQWTGPAASSTPGTYTDAGMTITAYGQNLQLAQGNGTIIGTRNFSYNVFDRWVILPARGSTMDHNYFHVGFRPSDCCSVSYQHNLFRKISSAYVALPGDTRNNYLITDEQRVGNPHVVYAYDLASVLHIDHNVFEYTADDVIYDGGDIGITNGSTTTYFDHNIVLPLNTLLGDSYSCTSSGVGSNGYTSGHLFVEHNTCFLYQGVSINESWESHIDTVKNNVFWRPDVRYSLDCLGFHMVRDASCGYGLATQPIDQVLAADYNGAWNYDPTPRPGAAGDGYGIRLSYTPGTHDVRQDPRFIDYRRNFGRWAASLGCAGGTYQQLVACGLGQLRLANDASYDARYSIEDALDWVRAGFAPTNPAYRGAADDGGDLGAVAAAIVPAGKKVSTELGGKVEMKRKVVVR